MHVTATMGLIVMGEKYPGKGIVNDLIKGLS